MTKSVDIKKYKFGVIGYGFLGESIVSSFALHANIKIYDKFKDFDSIEDVTANSDMIWICLPTPMDLTSGVIDLSIIEENLDIINKLSKKEDNKVVVIKSTVIPGTVRSFSERYTNLKFVSNPEFLTARNNRLDFICASRIIIGSLDDYAGDKMEEVYRYRFDNSINIYRCSLEEAELTKYSANCFFALKISYFNFVESMCKGLDVNFENVRDMTLADGRIGRSHANVPGWDGQRGYGGGCFPKDINALINFSKELGIDPKLLNASWAQNLEDRPNKDWEDIPSAVSNKDSK